MKKCLLIAYLLGLGGMGYTQNTVGLLGHQPERVYPGFNLVFPHNQSDVFLLDNCGQIVHTWADDSIYRPGNSVYLLENGNLVKTKRFFSPINDSIWAGGGGETVEIRDWNNTLVHSFSLNNDSARLHHDVAPMPNGNILMIAWELIPEGEALQAGRNPALLDQGKLWPDYILEWDPELDAIVWEWHAWDHLIQDFDATKDNFGVVAEHPERIDINFDTHNGHPDWMHANSIDYHPILDHILLSVPYFHEVWVIDHHHDTEETKGEAGDLLYRWGNPQTYRAGTPVAQQLFFPHDIHWIDVEASPDDSTFGFMAVFNNRVGDNYSTGNIFAPFDRLRGTYYIEGIPYGPEAFTQTIQHPIDSTLLYSNSLSSTQILPNGNALLFAGRWGYAVEISPDNELVWEYKVPLQFGGPVAQGTELGINDNLTFQLKRYGEDYEAFRGRDLSPLRYWELEANEDFCLQTVSRKVDILPEFLLYPNPANGILWVELPHGGRNRYLVHDMLGRTIREAYADKPDFQVDISAFKPGIYWINISGYQSQVFRVR